MIPNGERIVTSDRDARSLTIYPLKFLDLIKNKSAADPRIRPEISGGACLTGASGLGHAEVTIAWSPPARFNCTLLNKFVKSENLSG